MKISAIYSQYNIPPNLQTHMYRVTSLAKLISDNWTGPDNLSPKILLQACLLHDMGNIIKFDFENFPELLGEEVKNLDFWERVKRDMIRKYGIDEDAATIKICKELKVDNDTLFLVENWGFKNFTRIANSDNWEWKIAVYSDHRISPEGVVSLKQNLENKQHRYTLSRPNASHISTQAEELYNSAVKIEKDIQANISIALKKIQNPQIDDLVKQLLKVEL